MSRALILGVLESLLAVVFMFAGGMKLVLPADALAMPVELPWPLIHLIGVAEITGAIALILPRVVSIGPFVPLAAALGLMLIVSGATVAHLIGQGVGATPFTLVLALLCGVDAYIRWHATSYAAGF
jgi:hypothetical protein